MFDCRIYLFLRFIFEFLFFWIFLA